MFQILSDVLFFSPFCVCLTGTHRLIIIVCVCVALQKGRGRIGDSGLPICMSVCKWGLRRERERGGGNESIKRVSKGLPSSALTAYPNAARKEAFYNWDYAGGRAASRVKDFPFSAFWRAALGCVHCHRRSSFATHWRLPLGILLVHWQCGEASLCDVSETDTRISNPIGVE